MLKDNPNSWLQRRWEQLPLEQRIHVRKLSEELDEELNDEPVGEELYLGRAQSSIIEDIPGADILELQNKIESFDSDVDADENYSRRREHVAAYVKKARPPGAAPALAQPAGLMKKSAPEMKSDYEDDSEGEEALTQRKAVRRRAKGPPGKGLFGRHQ